MLKPVPNQTPGCLPSTHGEAHALRVGPGEWGPQTVERGEQSTMGWVMLIQGSQIQWL